MRQILFVVHVDSYFRNLIEVARLVAGHTVWKPLLYFPRLYPSVEADIETCQREGFDFVRGFSGTWQDDFSRIEAQPLPLASRLMSGIKRSFPVFLYGQIRHYLREIRRIRSFLDRTGASLLVVAGDNAGFDTALFIRECHRRGVLSVVIPAWMAGPLEAYNARAQSPQHDLDLPSNRICAALWPELVYQQGGHRIVRWHASEVVTMKLLGIFPPSPWALNSGFANAIVAESRAMFDYMTREGISPSQIRLAGSVSNDLLAAVCSEEVSRKRELYRLLELPEDRPLLLTALPPNQLYGHGRPGCEFQEYGELVHAWLKELASCTTHNVVVSLHPSQQADAMRYIEDYGAKISTERVMTLIPLCDLYVASISATIQWAIACGKPVVNYDVYRYGYTDYIGAKGVLLVENIDDYAAAVRRLAREPDFFESVRAIQAADAPYWGTMDGKSGERILELFAELMPEAAAQGRSSVSRSGEGRRLGWQ